MRIAKPSDLAGRGLRLKIRLEPLEGNLEGCRPSLRLAFHGSGPLLWSPPREGLEIEGILPEELYDQPTFSASVLITDALDGPGEGTSCAYRVAESSLEAVGAAHGVDAGVGGGTAEPALREGLGPAGATTDD